ncbi:hypothetical protein ACPDG4_15360, partial [Myroides sp. C20-1]
MIRKVLPLIALIMTGSAVAQIGIGTPKANSSAQLDIVAKDKGVLLPRVELKEIYDRSPIIGDVVESLLVYHVGNTAMKAGFYYWKSNMWTPLLSGDTYVDRMNHSFRIGLNPVTNTEALIITDTQNHNIYLSLSDIATNSAFVNAMINNNEFTMKLGNDSNFVTTISNNGDFVENVINKLRGIYGNVSYDSVTNRFYYLDGQGGEQLIDWSSLNTTNESFTLVSDRLIVTDSAGHAVSMPVVDIATNGAFITTLIDHSDLIAKLGDNHSFQTIVKENSLESSLTLTDQTVNQNQVKAGFNFNNGKDLNSIAFSETLTEMEKGSDANALTEYYFIDETGNRDATTIQITADIIDDFDKILADDTVKALLQQFIASAQGDVAVVR